jgi:hypothetical protein
MNCIALQWIDGTYGGERLNIFLLLIVVCELLYHGSLLGSTVESIIVFFMADSHYLGNGASNYFIAYYGVLD